MFLETNTQAYGDAISDNGVVSEEQTTLTNSPATGRRYLFYLIY